MDDAQGTIVHHRPSTPAGNRTHILASALEGVRGRSNSFRINRMMAGAARPGPSRDRVRRVSSYAAGGSPSCRLKVITRLGCGAGRRVNAISTPIPTKVFCRRVSRSERVLGAGKPFCFRTPGLTGSAAISSVAVPSQYPCSCSSKSMSACAMMSDWDIGAALDRSVGNTSQPRREARRSAAMADFATCTARARPVPGWHKTTFTDAYKTNREGSGDAVIRSGAGQVHPLRPHAATARSGSAASVRDQHGHAA
jgi:hypothetical protein